MAIQSPSSREADGTNCTSRCTVSQENVRMKPDPVEDSAGNSTGTAATTSRCPTAEPPVMLFSLAKAGGK